MPKKRLLLAGVTAVAVGATCADAQVSGTARTTRELLDEMRQYYEELLPDTRPETVKGSGYKPFKRYEWFMETRLGDAAGIPVGARQAAFERKQSMERGAFPTWFSMGPTNVAGRCLAIAVDPTDSNVVYAGFASSGIWKSTDGGVNWTPLGDDLPSMSVSAIALDESNPSTIYIGTGEGWGNVDALHGVGILKSTDGGATWNTTGFSYDIAAGLDVWRLEYEETTGVLLASVENGLWRSTDGAATFTEVMPDGSWPDVKLKPGTTDTYYAISRGWAGQGAYKSTDEGVTWTQLGGGAPTTAVTNGRLAVTPANPDYVYWSFDINGAGMRIYRSTDSGATWALRSTVNHDGSLGQGWYDLSIAVDPENSETVWSGGVEFYRSTNGATSFSQIASNVHVDHHEAVFDPSNPERMWLGSDGGVYLSTNGGTSFLSRNSGLVTLQFYAMNQSMNDPNIAFGGTQDNGTWRYVGTPSFGQVLGGDGFECEVSADNQLIFAEIYNGFHYRSTNGGAGFTPANSGITEDGPWQTPTHMDYSNSARVWTGHNAQIWRTTNSGVSWTSVMPANLGGGRSIAQCYNDPTHVYVAGGARIFLSTDTGATFNQMAQLSVGNSITDITVHPDDPLTAMLCTGSYSSSVARVLRTTDGGVNWTDVTNNLPGEGAQSITYKFDEPNVVFLGTDLGCYISFDEGGSWEPFDVGLPHVICDDLRWHPDNFLRVATHGRGMWEVDLTDLSPASVESGAPTIEPLTLRVLGNPAGPGIGTSLRFGLREAGRARIGLYDTGGRLVRLLLDREVEAKVDFVEIRTESLPSGVYFARLDAGDHSVTEKLVVKR